MQKKEIVSVSMSPELRQSLDEVGEARGESRSALVERLLRNAVAEEKKCLRILDNPIFQAVGLLVANAPGVMEVLTKIDPELVGEDVAALRDHINEQLARAKDRRRQRRRIGEPARSSEELGGLPA